MSMFKIDPASLELLGDGNWLSIVSIYDLAGRNDVQFMAERTLPVSQSRLSRYIRYLRDRYIRTFLNAYDGDIGAITVRNVFQGEDCPRHLRSVSWESQRDWTGVFLIPDPYYFLERGYEDFLPDGADLPAWSTRRPTVMWRGSTTGVVGADLHAIGFRADTLDQLPRYRMCRILKQLGEGADAGIVAIVQCPDGDRDAIAARLSAEGVAAGYVPSHAMSQCKYLMDIDGNTNSWNFVQRLRLGCCILKVESPWIQWLHDRARPWVHYVPVKADLSDLLEQVAWCRTHDEEAERIAANGRRLGLSIEFDAEMQQAALGILRTAAPLSGEPADAVVLEQMCAAAERLRPQWDAAIAAWSSFPQPCRLRTAHGTILGSDPGGALIQLDADGDLADAITLFDGDGRWRQTLHGYHIDRDAGTLSLERAGQFLSAQNNRVTTACDRLERGEWETFTLLPVGA